MKAIVNKIVRAAKQVRGLFSSPLPTGAGAFEAWVADIQATYTLPTQDSDSIHFCFATAVLHLGPTVASKPKYYFVLTLRAAASKQVAGAAFQAIKLHQKELVEAQMKAEATASTAVASAQTN